MSAMVTFVAEVVSVAVIHDSVVVAIDPYVVSFLSEESKLTLF